MKSPLSLTLNFFLIIFLASWVSSADIRCVLKNGKEGVQVCVRAFKEVFAARHRDILSNPRRLICCLTRALDLCLEQATIAARCINEDLESVISSARSFTSQLFVNAISTFIGKSCGQIKGCDEMTSETFGQAEKQILAMNAVNGSRLTSIPCSITVTILFALWSMSHLLLH